MSCQCEVYEICPECATTSIQYETAVQAHDDVVHRMKVSSAKSYTLDDFRRLMEQFLADMGNQGRSTIYGAGSLTDWKFETFLQWARKREREVVE